MRISNPKILTLVRKVVVYALAGFADLSSGESATDRAAYHEFGVSGEAVLCVPSSDMNPVLMPYNDESTDLAVGSGHHPGFGFLFEPDEVQRHLDIGMFRVRPELNGLTHVNILSGSVGFLSVPDSRRLTSSMRARDLEDEWYAKGRCPKVTVTPLDQSNLFEVRCATQNDYSNILNRAPDRTKPLPEPGSLVVATCVYETISAGKFAGQTLRSCRRVTVLDGFIIDYQLQEENMPLYQQIDKFLRNKIAEWRGNCLLAHSEVPYRTK